MKGSNFYLKKDIELFLVVIVLASVLALLNLISIGEEPLEGLAILR